MGQDLYTVVRERLPGVMLLWCQGWDPEEGEWALQAGEQQAEWPGAEPAKWPGWQSRVTWEEWEETQEEGSCTGPWRAQDFALFSRGTRENEMERRNKAGLCPSTLPWIKWLPGSAVNSFCVFSLRFSRWKWPDVSSWVPAVSTLYKGTDLRGVTS